VIEELYLKDFQRHAKLSIRLDPGVTTFVGPSHRGKSSVLRALRWLCLNRPGGEAFVRNGAEGAKVRLGVDDRTVTRSRSGTRNAYTLDGTPLIAFGSDVPSDVAAFLNVSEINFQDQHDPPFWFGKTGGEVSRELNRIVDLQSIDSTLAHLNRKLRIASTNTELLGERVKAARENRKSLLIVKQMHKDLLEVERLEQGHNVAVQRLAEATDLVEKVSRLTIEGDRLLKRKESALQAILKGDRWLETKGRRDEVKQLFEKGRSLEGWARFKAPPIKGVLDADRKRLESRAAVEELGVVLWDVMAKEEAAEIVTKRDSQSRLEFTKAMGDTCVLCGQTIPNPKS
jgi:hypothetical protein